MSLRGELQEGRCRRLATSLIGLIAGLSIFWFWPSDASLQEKLLIGFQRAAFVTVAFGVTAYNLRTRVVDLVLNVEGKPNRVRQFCLIARTCGKRLTNLVLLFTFSSVLLAGLTLFSPGTLVARISISVAAAAFSSSVVSLVYIFFSFERLERFALDEAETNAIAREAKRLEEEPVPKDSW